MDGSGAEASTKQEKVDLSRDEHGPDDGRERQVVPDVTVTEETIAWKYYLSIGLRDELDKRGFQFLVRASIDDFLFFFFALFLILLHSHPGLPYQSGVMAFKLSLRLVSLVSWLDGDRGQRLAGKVPW